MDFTVVKELVEHLPLPALIIYGNKIVSSNKKLEKYLGYTIEMLRGTLLTDIIIPDEKEKLIDCIPDRESNSIDVIACGLKVKHAKGNSISVRCFLSNIQMEDGEYVLCEFADCTMGKTDYDNNFMQVERELSIQNAYFNQLFENCPDAIAVLDNEGRVVNINKAFEIMFEYNIDDIRNDYINDLIIPDSCMDEGDMLHRRVVSGEFVKLETVRKCRGGGLIDVSLTSYPIMLGKKQIGMYAIYGDITKRKRAEKELIKSQDELKYQVNHLNMLIDNMNEIFFTYDREGRITFINKKCYELSGYAAEEFIGRDIVDLVSEEFKSIVREGIKSRLYKNESGSYEILFNHRDGSIRNVRLNISPIIIDGQVSGGLVLAQDITEHKKVLEELEIQRAYFKQLFDNSPRGVAIIDNDDNIIDVNKAFEKLFLYNSEDVIGKNINSIIVPDELYSQGVELSNTVFNSGTVQQDAVRMKSDGSLLDVSILAYPIILKNKSIGAFAIYGDITEQKRVEGQIRYLNLHDSLTGLYNRVYFEEEMKKADSDMKLSSGIIICDIDGLKLVNDSLGHEVGDMLLINAAEIIRHSCKKEYTASRIGGDEFAILVTDASRDTMDSICKDIKDKVQKHNRDNPGFPLNISIGYALQSRELQSMNDVFKEADNDMCREKLHGNKSSRSAIVQTLMKALEERDHITEGHADRLTVLVKRLASAVGLSKRSINDLSLFAQFHDIGKVGIPDRILFKPGPLDREEMLHMQKHSEIGYRIAKSSPDLEPVAKWILHHHEWWNGEGYPLKLKGRDIPIQCRILSIADAFDAMVSDRPYRKAMPKYKALEELEKCAGNQFDPELVAKFIDIMNSSDL